MQRPCILPLVLGRVAIVTAARGHKFESGSLVNLLFCFVGDGDLLLQLLDLGLYPPALASQVAGIMGVYHHSAWLINIFFCVSGDTGFLWIPTGMGC